MELSKDIITKEFTSTIPLIFEQQCEVSVTLGQPIIYLGPDRGWANDNTTYVFSWCRLVSDRELCKFAYCMEEKVFLKLVSKIYGEKFIELNDEIFDYCGEFLNSTFAHVRTNLEKNVNFEFESLPPFSSIVVKEFIPFEPTNDFPVIAYPIDSELGQFFGLFIFTN